jgi:hypothetical protein
MGMKIPKELEDKIISTPGVTVTRHGEIVSSAADAKQAVNDFLTTILVHHSVTLADGKLTLLVPFESKSETNQRQWQARSRRSCQAWKAVRKAIGRRITDLCTFCASYASGSALRVTFTRLGGRKMDRSNLPAAMKGCEDAIAYLLGADDGSPQWHAFFEQEPGGEVGVRIDVEIWQ